MGFILEGPENVEMGRILTVRAMLGLEIRTGMKHSRVSALKLANEITGETGRNKRKAYEALNAFIVARLGEEFNKPLA